MKVQTPIHVRIDYEDAFAAKKSILSSESDFIRILRTIKKYKLLREKELNYKLKMQKKLKELKTNIEKLNETLPKIKVPNILKKGELKEEVSKIKKTKEDNDLEAQLREIQQRLKKLG